MSEMKNGLITIFTRHRVAANLLMLLIILIGGWSLRKLNTQFLPTVNLNFIVTSIVWPGASADDVEKSLTTPIEKEFRDLDNVKELVSRSSDGWALVILEFHDGTDMAYALNQVNEKISLVRNLPEDAKKPVITRLENYEPIAKVIITGGNDLSELRQRAHTYERELLRRGISKISFTGLPNEEIAIQIPSGKLAELKFSLDQLAQVIRQRSKDTPAGDIGRYDVSQQLRSLDQQRDLFGFLNLPLITDSTGQLLRIKDVGTVERRPLDQSITARYHGKPAIEMQLLRSANASALRSAQILDQWLAETLPTLPPTLKVIKYDERWTFIKERITILLENGFFGFILIIAILFVTLNRRIAFWVAMGIPISLLASMVILYLAGGSIDMISMFAFIMTLGIIVDDTIVVAEEALTQMTSGKPVFDSVIEGAYKMLPPIAASSLTTIAAFFPLMFIGGVMGSILLTIPMVVICVLSASLLECFYVLPGHLYHSMKHHPPTEDSKHWLRKKIDDHFDHFKEHHYRRLVEVAVKNSGITLSLATAIFLVSIGLITGGRVNFTFFPEPESKVIRANAEFAAGTPKAIVDKFISELETGLNTINQQLSPNGESIVRNYLVVRNTLASERLEAESFVGDQNANIFVELTEPDTRPEIPNRRIIEAWRNSTTLPPELENLTINAPRLGPPGKDIEIRISGFEWDKLKDVSVLLQNDLKRYTGITDIKDNLPYGREQLIFKLSDEAKALGLTTESVGRQLRAAFSGELVQIFHEFNEEIEVRVTLPDNERYRLHTLESFPIITPNKEVIPLHNAITVEYKRSLNMLRHSQTLPSIRVQADVDNTLTNANNVIDQLRASIVPNLEKEYGVKIEFVGRAEEQNQAIADMKIGALVALALIYIILAWIFNSYTLPALIMLAIPLGITGAIVGHYLLGIDFTILSLFGVFGLSGIVINDSIILVDRFIQLRHKHENVDDAIVDASCQRLRAVLLTSLTTIAGLIPLLFETSLQAQFLIPMAVSITFGLMFSTVLVLVVVPSLLHAHQRMRSSLWAKKSA